MSFAYVASPYTSSDPDVIKRRFLAVEKYTADCLKKNVWVYSPVVHCHEIAEKYDLPKDFDFWKSYNYAMLSTAAKLHVLMLEGWDMSKGVSGEIELAMMIGIDVIYVEAEKEPV